MNIGLAVRHDCPKNATYKVTLPANDFPLVFIESDALRSIYDHAAEGFPVEIGGYYLGMPLIDTTSKVCATYIQECVRAIATSTRTHVTMHAETFRAVEERRAEKETLVVGYYHSHPGLSVFQSGEDLHNFRSYHPERYQIAVVADSTLVNRDKLDLHSAWIGFFAWNAKRQSIKLPPDNLFLITAEQSAFELITDRSYIVVDGSTSPGTDG